MRQYKKKKGRKIRDKTVNEIIEAEEVDGNDDLIVLVGEGREHKKMGKGKETVQKRQEIPYADIKEAIVTITF